MMNDYGGYHADVTTYTMVLIAKLWGFSWAYRDGMFNKYQLTADQEERKIVHLPNLLEYFSFVFFCNGCLVGPFIEFSDFKNFMELQGVYKSLPRGLKSG